MPICAVRVSGSERNGTSGRVTGRGGRRILAAQQGADHARRQGAMDTYELELKATDPDGFAITIPVFPGLLILGATLDEALARARASIAFHIPQPGAPRRNARIADAGSEAATNEV